MILDEFLVQLGVISDVKELDAFADGLKKVGTVATAVVATVGAVTGAVTAFFGAALNGLDDLANLSKDTDTELAYIQKLGYAAQLSGSSVEAANASVKGLAQTIGEAASGLGRGQAAFKAFGMSAKNADGSVKSVGQVLEEVQGKLDGLSRAEQLSMLQKLGIDQSMIQLLGAGSAGMAELFQRAEDLGLVTADGADAAQGFNDALSEMHMVAGALRTNIAVGLAPQLTNLIGGLRDWLIRNKELIREGIDKVVTGVLATWRAIWRFIEAIDKVVDKTIGWKALLLILGGTFIWLKHVMLGAFLTNPITLIFAAIAGLILLVDDLVTYMEGGESLFDWGWAMPIIEGVGKAIDFVKENLKGLAVVAAFVGTALLTALPAASLVSGVGSVTGAIGGLIRLLLGPFITVLSVVSKAITAAFISNPIGLLIAAIVAVAVAIYLYWDEISAYLSKWADWLKAKWHELAIKLVMTWWSVQDEISAALNNLKDKFSAVWESLKNGFKAAMDFVRRTWDAMFGSISSGLDKIGGFLSGAAVKVGLASNTVAAAQAAAHPANAGGTTNSSRTTHAPVTVNQNISTNDPRTAADMSAKAIRREQQRALTNAGGAVAF